MRKLHEPFGFRRLRLVVSAVVAVLAPGCGGGGSGDHDGGADGHDGRVCNQENCKGCCLDDVCYTGRDSDACGRNGGACSACGQGMACVQGVCVEASTNCTTDGDCPGYERCLDGVCVGPCDTCAGCCAQGSCRDGDSNDACGSNGEDCVRCEPNENCVEGQCMPVTIEAFETVSPSLSEYDGNLLLSISDIPGNTGCGLSASVDAAPAVDGHQVIMSIVGAYSLYNERCRDGAYPIDPDCSHGGLGGWTCAEYRKWQGGKAIESSMAISGMITIEEANGCCTFDISLGFGTSGTYVEQLNIGPSGASPWCDQCR